MKVLLTPFLLLISLISFSQTREITGKVFDENNLPVNGATVFTKDKKNTTQTNAEGAFTLSTTAKGTVTILISNTGFNTETIAWDGKNLTVKLDKKTTVLDEVVAVGYANVKRKDLLASVSSVSAKDLKDIPINSAAEALNGRLAGVTATTAEGSPDANVRIRVRGGMSITGDNNPLFIIDGIQVENGLSTISPQDIQNIDVLKDAAATAIYGAS